MKRICYLVVWLLTGFSIAANESSLQPATLFSISETPEHSEADLTLEAECEEMLPENEPETNDLLQVNLVPAFNFICCAKR